MLKRSLFTALAAAAVSTSALIAPALLTPAAAQGINIQIGTPPPAPIYEVVPAPRAGYVWAPGYWRWNGHRYFWVPGYWVPSRHGYRWVPSHWVAYGPRWRYVPGYWAH